MVWGLHVQSTFENSSSFQREKITLLHSSFFNPGFLPDPDKANGINQSYSNWSISVIFILILAQQLVEEDFILWMMLVLVCTEFVVCNIG